MSVTEDRRIALLEAAHQHWGRDVAVTLMEMLPPSGWGDVATRQRVDSFERGMDLRFQLVDQRFEALEARLDARLDARIDGLEARLDARLDAHDAGFAVVRHEMETGFATLEARLDARLDAHDAGFAIVRHEMETGFATLEARMVRWFVGTGIALLGALCALGGLALALR